MREAGKCSGSKVAVSLEESEEIDLHLEGVRQTCPADPTLAVPRSNWSP